MALSFDDLPDATPKAAGLSFDDLPDEAPAPKAGGMAGALMAAQPAQQAQGGIDPWQLYYGAARSVDNMGLAGGRVIGIPGAQSIDKLRSLFSDQPTHAAEDFVNEKLRQLQARADSLAPKPNDSLPNKLLNATGGFGGNLAAMAATGGLSRAPALAEMASTNALPGVLNQVGQATRTMAVPATTDAVNTGHDVYAETGDLPDALKAAAVTGAANVGMGLLPAALPGNLATRLVSGAPIGALTGEGTRQLRNMALPETMQQPFNAQDALVNALTGSVLAGALGRAPERRDVTPQPEPMQQPVQQAQGMPQTAPVLMPTPAPAAPVPMPTPAPAASAAPIAPQAAPALPPKVPFAGSASVRPLFESMGMDQAQMDKSLDLLRPAEADIEARRRGVVSEAEQKRLANLLGLDGAQALAHGRKLGQTFNAEQFRAVTSAVQTQMTSVLEMQQRIASGQASDIDRAQFVDDLANMRRTTGELLGARAEVGRALAAQRRQVADIRQAQAILESVGGVSGADDLATAIGEAIRSGGLQNAAKVIQKGNHITDYIKAGWLYDPTTHFANMAGNTGMVGVNTMDRVNAAVLAGAKRMFGLKGETTWSEPVALLSGAIRGQAKAVAATQKAFMEGESPLLGSGKLEASTLPRRTMPGLKGTAKLAFDNTALAPFRFLGAEDAYFAVTQYEASLRALAHRAASAEKKADALPQGVKLSQRIEQLVDSPTPAMIEQSGDFARESTFNKRAGPFGSKLLAAKAAVPWLNIVIPFVRTPLAVLERAWKGSPLGLTTPGVWRDIRAGGATQEAAISKMMTGTQIMIGAGLLAQAGFLSGNGPDDDKERAAWLAAGNQPYSVRIGDTWYGINRLDPFAMWAGSVADLVQTDWKNKTAEQRALKLVSTFADNIVSKTWMSGVEGLSLALSDPERYMPNYLQRTGASLLQPNALASGIAARQDEFARKPDSLLEAIKVRTPGLRESVPVRQDAWGQPLANNRQGDSLFNALAPMTHVDVSEDPVRLEAARIGWVPGGMQNHFSVPPGKRGVPGKRFDLTDDQLRELSEIAGARMHAAARNLMRTRYWEVLNDDERADQLDKIMKEARASARAAFVPYLSANKRGLIDLYRKQTSAWKRTDGGKKNEYRD